MQNVSQIIHAKWIIPCENAEILENHALILDKDRILDILPSNLADQQYDATHIEPFKTHALLPGFINTHTHIGMNFFRGLADDLALMNWLNQHIWPAERLWVSHDFVYDASLFAMAEMIRSGTTAFNEMYFFLEATAKAALKAGLRAHIGITVIDFETKWAKNPEEYIEKGLNFYETYKNHETITTTFAPHAIYTVGDPTLIKIRDLAEQYQLKINIHLHETADEIQQSIAQTGKRPVKRLHEMGLLGDNLIAVHMTQINDEDLDILEQAKPHIVHCPESNMKLASGACPVQKILDRKLNVSLGTDGVASNNDLDMISEMRSATFLAKLTSQNPESLPALQAIKMATINSAKTLGIDRVTGSLVKGKKADFIAINLHEIETLPLYHPASQIVYASGRTQVSDVWIAGQRVMKHRKLLTLNEEELKEKAEFWQNKILNS